MVNHPTASFKLTSSVKTFMGGPPLSASSYEQRGGGWRFGGKVKWRDGIKGGWGNREQGRQNETTTRRKREEKHCEREPSGQLEYSDSQPTYGHHGRAVWLVPVSVSQLFLLHNGTITPLLPGTERGQLSGYDFGDLESNVGCMCVWVLI